MSSHRIDQVNSLLREQISDILIRLVDREHFPLLSITRVITSKDLSSAKVYVSLAKTPFASFRSWLKSHIYEVQGELNSRLSFHRIPRLSFLEDTTGDYVERMDTLFRRIEDQSGHSE